MKPPICEVCRKDFRKNPRDGATVRFKRTQEQIVEAERRKQARHTGHPIGTAWICNDHLELARSFSHLDIASAFEKIKEALKGIGKK